MSKNNVVKLAGRDTITDPLTELLRTGAEQLICQAVEAELLELCKRMGNYRIDPTFPGLPFLNSAAVDLSEPAPI